jgi:hypothetical protein
VYRKCDWLTPESNACLHPYSDLYAFDTGTKGFGVKSKSIIHYNHYVVEVLGRWLDDDDEAEALPDQRYLFTIDDEEGNVLRCSFVTLPWKLQHMACAWRVHGMRMACT